MAVVVGTFGTQVEAEDALASLRAAGLDDGDLALLTHARDAVGAPDDPDQRANRTVDVATIGAAVGAVLGGALLGPVGAVVGGLAAGGGLAAALETRGMTREEAMEYEARLASGRYTLVVNAGAREADVRDLLRRAGADRVEIER
jgi:hypothetical protein